MDLRNKRNAIVAAALLICSTLSASPSLGEGTGVGLTLQQLLDSARHNNITLRNARRSVEAAVQQRKEAFTKYFPNISGTGLWFNANRGMAKMEMNPQDMIPAEYGAMLSQMLPAEALAALSSPIGMSMMKNGTIASVMAMQPVFAGGQIVNGNKLAKVGEEVSRLQLQLSENEVEKTTVQYYWQLVSLQEKLHTVAAVDSLLSDISRKVEVAVKAGVTNRNDLLQVQLRQNDLESQKLKLRNGINIVKLLLAQYCGLSGSEELRVKSVGSEELRVKSEEFATAIPTPHDTEAAANSSLFTLHSSLKDSSLFTLHSSLNTLPEYQLLEKQVEAAKLQQRMAVGQNLPTVAVGAGYNYHNLMENDRTFGMIFATVSIPITGWWGGSHAIKRRKIEYEKAVDQLADNSQLLNIRLQNAANSVGEAYQQLQLAARGIEQAQENLRLNQDYYKAGTSTMSDLLEAQMLYQQALDRRTEAYADYQVKLVDYRQAGGN